MELSSALLIAVRRMGEDTADPRLEIRLDFCHRNDVGGLGVHIEQIGFMNIRGPVAHALTRNAWVQASKTVARIQPLVTHPMAITVLICRCTGVLARSVP